MFSKIISLIMIYYMISFNFAFSQGHNSNMQTSDMLATNQSTNIQTNNQANNWFGILPTNVNPQTNSEPLFVQDLQNRNSNSNVWAMFFRSIAGFLFFFLILFIVYKYLKKRSKTVMGSSNIINVLASTTIGQNKHLLIVEILENIYFISSADKSINLLSEITDKDTKDMIRMAYAKSSSNVVEDPFSSILDKALSSLNIKRKKDKSPLEETSSIKERIRNMNSDIENHINNQDTIDIFKNIDDRKKTSSKKTIKKDKD